MLPVFIDLLRHGPVAGEPALYGSTDVKLQTEGLLLMQRQLNEHALEYAQVVSSPMSRCLEFAELFARQHDLELVLNGDCREYHFGSLDGKPFGQASAQELQWLDLFWQQPAQIELPEAESFEAFTARIAGFWQFIATEALQQGNQLVVCHGGVIKALLAQLLAMPLNRTYQHLEIGYASLTRIQLWNSPENFRLLFSGMPAR